MHVQFDLTREDVVSVQLERRAFTSPERCRQLLEVILPNSLILVLGWICCQLTPPRSHYLPFVLAFIGCTVYTNALIDYRRRRAQREAALILNSYNAIQIGQHGVDIDNKSMTISINGHFRILPWEDVGKVVRYGSYCTVSPKIGPILLIPTRAFPQWEDFICFTKISVMEHYYREDRHFGSKKKRKETVGLPASPPIKFEMNTGRPVIGKEEPTGIYPN
jgi:hypothetical protein